MDEKRKVYKGISQSGIHGLFDAKSRIMAMHISEKEFNDDKSLAEYCNRLNWELVEKT